MVAVDSLEFVFHEKLLDGERHVRECIVMAKKPVTFPPKFRPFLSQRFSETP
jgi:hypothetical protein